MFIIAITHTEVPRAADLSWPGELESKTHNLNMCFIFKQTYIPVTIICQYRNHLPYSTGNFWVDTIY